MLSADPVTILCDVDGKFSGYIFNDVAGEPVVMQHRYLNVFKITDSRRSYEAPTVIEDNPDADTLEAILEEVSYYF